MKVVFTKLSDDRHRVTVERRDGSREVVELDTRSFLRHDLAHLAVELELGLAGGVWGSVAGGGSLSGDGLDGPDMDRAESVAGPMQTMMRIQAPAEAILEVLTRVAPDIATPEVADGIHARMRALAGHWAATPYGSDMDLDWPEPPT